MWYGAIMFSWYTKESHSDFEVRSYPDLGVSHDTYPRSSIYEVNMSYETLLRWKRVERGVKIITPFLLSTSSTKNPFLVPERSTYNNDA